MHVMYKIFFAMLQCSVHALIMCLHPQVVEAAHQVGLRTTSTIMFGHVDNPSHWAQHLVRVDTMSTVALVS